MRVFAVDSGLYGARIEGVFRDPEAARVLAETIPSARVRPWSVLRVLPASLPRYGPVGADDVGAGTDDEGELPPVLHLVMTGERDDLRLEAVVADEAVALALEAHWWEVIVTVHRFELEAATGSWFPRPTLGSDEAMYAGELAGRLELERLAEVVRGAMERARDEFSAWAVPDGRSPERADLAAVLEATSTLASALAALLDGLDRALGNEGAAAWVPLVPWEDVRGLVARWFPAPSTVGAFHPGRARSRGLIGLLPELYGVLNERDVALSRREIPRSFVWRETVTLWTSLAYLGGAHASGGLPSRLERIARLPDRRSGPRGRAYYPWDRTDIAGLEEIARRGAHLLTASDAELDEAACRSWCEVADG